MLPTQQPYLIGETAFHHEGDLDFLKELIQHASDLKLSAIKGHLLLDLDDYMISNHKVIDILRPWCLDSSQWAEAVKMANNLSLDVVLLCNDATSLEWVLNCGLDIKAIEIHATGLNDYFLLEKASRFKGTVILGVGGSTLEEIKYAIDFLRARGQEDLFLMHGFQNYPTDFRDIQLSKMQQINQLFNLPVGYADHTDPNDSDNETISILGAAMGFNVLEKHFTHKFGVKRTDAQAAISLEQMKKVQTLLRKTVAAYGDNSLTMSDAEKKYGNTGPMKKAIVARRDIAAGEVLTLEHIAFKRTNEGTYVKQKQMGQLLGSTTNQDILKDTIIDFSNIEYTFKVDDFSQFENK